MLMRFSAFKTIQVISAKDFTTYALSDIENTTSTFPMTSKASIIRSCFVYFDSMETDPSKITYTNSGVFSS